VTTQESLSDIKVKKPVRSHVIAKRYSELRYIYMSVSTQQNGPKVMPLHKTIHQLLTQRLPGW